MNVTVFAGKGGVGKSTSAAAFALRKAEKEEVLVVDYDGGHSLTRVLSLRDPEPNKVVSTDIDNLRLAVIDPLRFTPIDDVKFEGGSTADYLKQFESDQGLVAFCDMANSFFGVPTDTHNVSKFAALINAYYTAKNKGVSEIVIDVEPTAGLETLLDSTKRTSRSIRNLSQSGRITLAAIGAKWPDIKTYLKGAYMQEAESYMKRMETTAEHIRGAHYFIVCIPESSPVDEMSDVRKVVERFGGVVSGYVINNMRGEPHEERQIERVEAIARDLLIIQVAHDPRLCDYGHNARHRALREVGEKFDVYKGTGVKKSETGINSSSGDGPYRPRKGSWFMS